MERDLNKIRKKDGLIDADDEQEEEPSFPLLDTPDEEVRRFLL